MPNFRKTAMARPDAPRKPSTAKRMFWMLLISLLVFGGVFFVKWQASKGMNAMFDNMSPQPAAVSAYVAKAERWSDRVEAVGTLTAVNGTDVTTEAGGVIREIAFEAGQPVKAGTVLVRLNSANEAATLKALEAAARLAVVQRDRWRELARDKLVSQADAEQRGTDAASALAQAEAQRALIDQKTIRAPFDGVLGIRRVNLGQYIAPGAAIVSLQSMDPIHLDFALPEQRLGQVVEGTMVSVAIDALPGKSFEGRISAIEPQVNPATRNFNVQATLRNPGGELRPGTFARASFALGGEREVVVIPQTAVSFNPYGNAVYVIGNAAGTSNTQAPGTDRKGGTLVASQRFIKTGATRGDLIAVTEGLKAGERVAASGLLKLRNNAPVTINNTVQPASDARPDVRNR
jgi:membrane fusion protein, multidrug efflux system